MIKTTNKAIKEAFPSKKIFGFSYCSIQNLLKYQDKYAYTCGAYGWNANFYQVGDYCISTGYRHIGQRVNYDLVNKYEEEARKIIETRPYKRAKLLVNRRLIKLLNELSKGVK